MTVQAAPAAEPASPASFETKTLQQWLIDPSLSLQAKVILMILRPLIELNGVAQAYREDLADAIGQSTQQVSRAVSDLERRQILFSRRGGRGVAKSFTFGAAVSQFRNNSFVAFAQTRAHVNVNCGLWDLGSAEATPVSPQTELPLVPPAPPPRSRSYSYISDDPKTTPASRVVVAKEIQARYGIDRKCATRLAQRLPLDALDALDALDGTIRRLMAVPSMSAVTAVRLAVDFPDRCEPWLFALPYKRELKDPGAFLVAAISGNYALPAPAARQIAKADVSIAKPLEPVSTADEKKAQRDAALQYFLRLSAPLRKQIEQRADTWTRKVLGNVDQSHRELALLTEIRRYRKSIGLPI